jgi:ESCRT-II complex subunit VPS36
VDRRVGRSRPVRGVSRSVLYRALGRSLMSRNNKVPGYQIMTVHITTHRLLLVPEAEGSSSSARQPALQAPLSAVRQTEFYAGFMRSSAKITLNLGWAGSTGNGEASARTSTSTPASGVASGAASRTGTPAPTAPASLVTLGFGSGPASTSPAPAASSWTCGVCGNINALSHGTTVAPSSKCTLCGVAYVTSRTMSPPPSRPASAAPALAQAPAPAPRPAPAPVPTHPIQATPLLPPPAPAPSGSAPSGLSEARTSGEDAPKTDSNQIACPACTFLNHASMTACEICETPLPRKECERASREQKDRDRDTSSPALNSPIPPPDDRDRDRDRSETVRLSFRRGGERDAYKRLKGVLSDKVWERVAAPNARPARARAGGGGIGELQRRYLQLTLRRDYEEYLTGRTGARCRYAGRVP